MAGHRIDLIWDQLLDDIKDERVIPILGRDLLTVKVDGKSVQFHDHVAELLARKLHVSLDPPLNGDPINTVACRYLEEEGGIDDVYGALHSVMPDLNTLEMPETLVQLAEIQPLELFVTTSFDLLLEETLNRTRFGGDERTTSLTYYPEQVNSDLPAPVDSLDTPVVYHLFGRVSRYPEFALTEADTLEFMHNLQHETARPKLLFDELNRRQLLLVGYSFPDWLTRFLLRITKGKPLSAPAGGKREILAGNASGENGSLAYFLQHFSTGTKMLPGDTKDFVNELHRRWKETYPELIASPSKAPEPPPADDENLPEDIVSDAIFLSYASEDRSAVESIKLRLEQEKLPIWFDRKQLKGGDRFETKIRRNIQKCSIFMPVISKNCLTGADRFFRLEWHHARDKAKTRREDLPFIVPVVVDDTDPNSDDVLKGVPQEILDKDWVKLPNGSVTDDFASEILTQFRRIQKEMSA